jgi:4-diphosphocytidyl-2-C-methyl-D-erythritol kinase
VIGMPHLLYRCYAKVNLTLEVLGKRSDGYHDLASLVHTISLADDLRMDSATRLLTRVEGMDIEPSANLVAQAAQLLTASISSSSHLGAEVTLVKRIPAAAGLGGGSSDAATTLVGLNRLWDCRLGIAELTNLAAELGSDVPFFVRGGAALMRGRGEVLEALPSLVGQWLIVVVPSHDVLDKTRVLYQALRPSDYSAGDATARAVAGVRKRLPLAAADLTNAFTRAAREIFPGLSTSWAECERVCGRGFYLSGAGPALFSLASDRTDARRQVATLARIGLPAYPARTIKHARAALKFTADTPIRYS